MTWRWEYLSTRPFLARYALAAYYIRHMPVVIELGGYKNCIADFLPQSTEVWAIDPLLDIKERPGVTAMRVPFQSVDYSVMQDKLYGLVCLGFDPEGNGAIETFVKLANDAMVVVVEFPLTYARSVSTWDAVRPEIRKREVLRVKMDFEGNNLQLPAGSYPPFYMRIMMVLE